MPIRDFAVYVGGQRLDQHVPFTQTLEIAREHNGIAWMQLDHPNPDEVRELAEELGIHNLVVEDAINGHQRSKIERYGNLLYVVLHPATYDENVKRIRYGEIHVIVGPEYAITICRDEGPTSAAIVDKIDHDRTLAGHSSLALLHALLDAVVDGYQPIVNIIESEVDEVEDQLFNLDGAIFQRIYQLLREVIVLQRATRSLDAITRALESGIIFHADPWDANPADFAGVSDLELVRQWRDVLDHAISISDRAEEFRQVLENALAVHSTLVAQEQNEETRRMTQIALKVSSWAAIFFAPTLIAGIYGMNFANMPELQWWFGYPLALGMMVVFVFALYRLFKKAGWL